MSRAAVDLDADSREALELDDLLRAVAAHAATAAGAARLREAPPAADAATVRRLQAETAAARDEVARGGRFVPGGLPDARPALRALAVEGQALEARALRDVARVLETADEVRRRLRGAGEALAARVRDAADLRRPAEELLRAIEPEGRLADDASPALARLRRARVQAGERLRRQLEGLLRDPRAGATIRDDFVTERNGRFVVPVRTDAPEPLRGIVHATSSSGATRFVEPLDAVEANNERVRLAEEEAEEEQRLLAGWSDGLRARLDDVRDALARIAALDAIQARALWAEARDAVPPELPDPARVELRGARHPLLDDRLREAGERAVPLDLTLDPADRVLVISGPNTGGKTVALKTLGLFALMAQSGLPLPASTARLPVYRQVRADIGDHQSIQADLSTYSAHVAAIAGVLRAARPPALFLFDEIGGGTEPREGAALARAVLERLQGPGVTVAVTTHLGELKAWSLLREGAVAAAMDFDTERLRPTYRLLQGTAGVSAGLDIAARLGIPADVLERARSGLEPDADESERLLQTLRARALELERRAEALAGAERDAERRRAELEARAREEALRAARRAERERAAELKRMRDVLQRELAGIRDRKERDRAERGVRRARARVEAEARRARPAPGVAGEGGPGPDDRPLPGRLEAGAGVWVGSLGRPARVVEDRGKRLEVDLGGMRISVERADLAPLAGSAPATGAGSRPGAVRVHRAERATGDGAGAAAAEGVADPGSATELKLIGKTVDEATPLLERFLDRAALDGHDRVRIVHGHGTGRLRDAVRELLDGHALVRAWRPGGPREGGEGATVAELG